MKNAELMIVRKIAVVFEFLNEARNINYFVVENMNRIGFGVESG